jgi:hypothetical protein
VKIIIQFTGMNVLEQKKNVLLMARRDKPCKKQ